MPSSGNVAWSNFACFQDVSETRWHASQKFGNPAATWLGLAAF